MTTVTPRVAVPPARFDRSLSRAVDHAVVQIEAAKTEGDAASVRAWRRVLAELELHIPESRP